jgi:hypothetical protein
MHYVIDIIDRIIYKLQDSYLPIIYCHHPLVTSTTMKSTQQTNLHTINNNNSNSTSSLSASLNLVKMTCPKLSIIRKYNKQFAQIIEVS